MAFKSLRDYVRLLEERGHLARVSHPISADLEITEITDRVCKGPLSHNRALLFEQVQGSEMPVATNLLGHPERMAWALGRDSLSNLTTDMASLIDLRLPQGVGAVIERGRSLLEALRGVGLRTHLVRNAPVQEVVWQGDEVDLTRLPILKCWPADGGRYITLPSVITRDPVSGARNVGMYRLQLYDRQTLGMHWQLHKGGADHERSTPMGDRIPVAISLGGDPAVIWSGSAPLPPGVDEFLLAGWLRGKPVELARCVTQPLEVPAEAEIVIEGTVDPAERRPEGPFGDHTGYYTPVDDYPVLHVTALTRRRDAIYPATVVGIPPMEDYWMGKATERLFLPLMQLFAGEIVDWHMPAEGVFHNLVLVSIHKRYPGQARKVINALWGMGLMSLTKAIIIFDADVDVQDTHRALFHALGNVDWSRDVIIQDGPVDALDHASHRFAFGGRIGIDATRKLPEEGYERPWPDLVAMDPAVQERIDALWRDLNL
jgi:4-hydroxy-3-polyprenylbenzoate decarboxylase